jgi:hypothetical protein
MALDRQYFVWLYCRASPQAACLHTLLEAVTLYVVCVYFTHVPSFWIANQLRTLNRQVTISSLACCRHRA